MILTLANNIPQQEIQNLVQRLKSMGFHPVVNQSENSHSLAIVKGIDDNVNIEAFYSLPYVEKVGKFSQAYKLAGNEFQKNKLAIKIKNQLIGSDNLIVMAGPCSVENEGQIHRIASSVAQSGAQILRGGAFKPRTSPYDFQGLGKEAIRYLKSAAQAHQLLTVSEVMDAKQLELLVGEIDILQVGARNMQNFSLLKLLGEINEPVMLKRGFAATYKDFLMAAEYILSVGNPNVILCERGIRTFENYTRNTLDIAAVPVLKQLSHLPVVVDPSHGTGIRSLVAPMARAAVAAQADGIMVEVHTQPEKSVSDASQAISREDFAKLMLSLRKIHCLVRDS